MAFGAYHFVDFFGWCTPSGTMMDRPRPIPTGLILSLVSLVLLPSAAMAQNATRDTGWAIDRFEPAPVGDAFFSAEHPQTPPRGGLSSAGAFHLGLTLDYARRPLAYSPIDRTSGLPVFSVVDHFVATHLQASATVHERLSLNADIPLAVAISGEAASVIAAGVVEGFALGDPRLGLRMRLAGHAENDPISVYASAQGFLGFLNASKRSQFTTDESFRGRASLVLAGRIAAVRWSLAGGYHARPRVSFGAADTLVVASELFFNAGVAYSLLDNRLSLGLEGWMQTVVERAFQSQHVAGEVIAEARYRLIPSLELAAGLGPGITREVGVPSIRGVFSIAWTPFDGSRVPAHSAEQSDRDELVGPRETHDSPQVTRVQSVRTTRQTVLADCELGAPCPEASRDPDGDGVLAPVDLCPSTPRGATPDPTRAGCPDGDQDADTVVDHLDACPQEPAGAHPDPLHAGCALHDRDHDNIADADDHCPDEPGAPSPDPAHNGCPSVVQMEAGGFRILQPVHFATARATILPDSFAVLQAVADALRARTEVRRVSVEGHTDARGNIELNVDLSNRRAISVMLWLVAHGVEPQRLEAHGFGPTVPIAPNTTAAGREQNRRVQFRIVDPAPVAAPGASQAPAGATSTSSSSSPPVVGAPAAATATPPAATTTATARRAARPARPAR
jgi:outer membrane protein OmpA-like peptidoglycan-associated protein